MRLAGLIFLAALPGTAQRAPAVPSQPWVPPAADHAATVRATSGGETRLDPAHVYTLPELVDQAEQHNPDTRVAWEAAKLRASDLRIARSDLLPTLVAVALANTTRQGPL